MFISPPIRFRIEWADSQGKVTASWLAAHFNFQTKLSNTLRAIEIRLPHCCTSSLDNLGRGNLALPAIANVFSLTFSVVSPTKIPGKKLTPP
jgi:hypothetical protein